MRAAGSLIVVAALIAPAAAEPAAVRRIVIVNPTPELAHAARTALAPWTIEVVEEAYGAPVEPGAVATIAQDRVADRVAWLANGELIVVDPITGETDRLPAPTGASDAPAAASVALSLKTLLRLPLLPDPVAVVAPPVTDELAVGAAAAPRSRPRMRVVSEVGGGVRFPIDGSLGVQTRFAVGAGIVQPHRSWLRPSLLVGFGPAVDAGHNGLKARWSDIEVAAQLALEVRVARTVAFAPRVRVAGHRTHLAGKLSGVDLIETAYGGEAGLDLAFWWRTDRFRAGAGVGAGVWVGLSDYSRGNTVVFEHQRLAASAFATMLVDL